MLDSRGGIERRAGLRRTFSWHASVGIWAAIGMLFLSATGITWSQLGGENVTKLRAALIWETPAISTELTGESATESADAGGAGDHSGHEGHEGHEGHDAHAEHNGDEAGTGQGSTTDTFGVDPADFDMMLDMAHGVNIDTGAVEILPPTDANSAWVVQEIQRSSPTKVDAVTFDPTTMEVTDRVDFADYGLAAKLARWGIDLHMGSLFGLANQIVLFVLAIGIAAMVVWGYVMWWQRRPKHDPTRRCGVKPPRGALLNAPWWGTGVIVVAGIGIGIFLPMVGISLVVFLIIDVALGVLARRRERVTD